MFYFCKMQATGNDFVIINCIKQNFEYSYRLLAQFLCNRHYGVGADGLIVIDKSEIADFKMRIFNSNGEEAEMCGNGIRCLAKYVFEHNLLKKEELKIETKSGIKDISLIIEGKTVIKAIVNMGKPIFDFGKIPVICERKEVKIDGIRFYPISLGNPHAVCFIDDFEKIDIDYIGEKVENYKCFPNKTNVEFVKIIDEKNIKIKIWERGVGRTLSCGTGCCVAAIISNIHKSTKCDIFVETDGGILKIRYDKENEIVFLEGEAKEVFEGTINI